jgi:hypothetical protein
MHPASSVIHWKRRVLIVVRGFLLFVLFLPVLCAAQGDVCKDSVQAQAWKSSPVYADAGKLAQRLESHGLKIDCMRRSTEEHLFEGQKGAAWVKTNQGIFEVWFLPSGEDFDKLEIKETVTQDKRYVYSFRGLSRVPPTIDSSQRIVFIKHGDVLFKVWGNGALAAQLHESIARAP